ncbi:MAG: hypothetical protein E7E41_10985, partial [Klebsiella oxytoca]|nr:hypothetical protein [Klebsiella oxytoca]MDU3328354.1 hypothetical protein [Klebsiella oxytoca]MDU5359112.1 hypothetical protein [Klebsiella oxytoca]
TAKARVSAASETLNTDFIAFPFISTGRSPARTSCLMKKSCQFYNLLFYNNQDNSCCTILIRDNVKRTDMGRYFGAS